MQIAVLIGILALAVAWLAPLWSSQIAGVALLCVAVDRLAGHATRGKAPRPAPAEEHPPDPGPQVPLSARWYIESTSGCPLPHSCSFVEFDERGDYLNFEQHRHAYEKIEALGKEAAPLTVVIFVHGWRHSSQSANVVDFNEFLHQLAVASPSERARRVHGVYLGWRGASFKHQVEEDEKFKQVTGYFGGEIIDQRERARIGYLNLILETLGYFNRKSVPEFKFSGTSISRTLFSCAYSAKRNQNGAEVMLFGHSFGGLMLERTFQNAAIGRLTEAWPWGKTPPADAAINPLPFDTVIMINSASPSIYAKQFQSYLAAHRQAMLKERVPNADTPIVFSLTSSADWATGWAHPIANSLSWLVPTLQRSYRGDEFILEKAADNAKVIIPQWRYYQRTPGHNPLLVNRFIEAVSSRRPAAASRGYVAENIRSARVNPLEFSTMVGKKNESRLWRINFPPETDAFNSFSLFEGRRPVAWTKIHGRFVYRETAYWIIRCPADIIAGHNDIWSQSAMDTYAALHRLSGHRVVESL